MSNMKKKEFIDYVTALMDYTKEMDAPVMSDNAQMYWDILRAEQESEKPMFTDNGKLILDYLQKNQEAKMWKARDIAEGLFISSRTVSGAMRKLVTDGFVEKVGQDPVVYALTESGKNIVIE